MKIRFLLSFAVISSLATAGETPDVQSLDSGEQQHVDSSGHSADEEAPVPSQLTPEQQQRLQLRLRELKQEFKSGEDQLAALEQRAEALRNTLLRLSGAIQVLEELGVVDEDEESEPEE